jgi:hypothetical protein
MNPYEILGVNTDATYAEIKSAYRKLVKRFHPDVNRDQSEVRIKQLNEAYDILSDPLRKTAYDRGDTEYTFEYEEDPQEVYRREYIERKLAERQQKRADYNRKARAIYKFLRLIAFPALVFSSLIVIDRYLPQHEYYEVAVDGWQERIGTHKYGGRTLVSFMATKHFIIAVPHQIHLSYDYLATDKPLLTIAISPIFKIPSTVSFVKNGMNHSADIKLTIYSNPGRLHYIMLFTSLFVVLRKDYSNFNFTVALLPAMLLFFIWLMFF